MSYVAVNYGRVEVYYVVKENSTLVHVMDGKADESGRIFMGVMWNFKGWSNLDGGYTPNKPSDVPKGKAVVFHGHGGWRYYFKAERMIWLATAHSLNEFTTIEHELQVDKPQVEFPLRHIYFKNYNMIRKTDSGDALMMDVEGESFKKVL